MALFSQFQGISVTISAVDRVSAVFRRIEGRTAGFRSKLAAVGRVAAKIGAALLTIGGAAIYAGTRLVTGFIDKASGLVDAADRIGITAERFQELTLVAQQFGVEQGQLEIALRKFVKEGGNVDEIAGSVADRFAGITDETLAAKAAVKLFGRTGQSLLPMLRQGSRSLAAMVEEFRRLGAVQSEDTLRRAESLGDAFERVKAALGGVVGAGFTAFLPDLERLTQRLTEFLAIPSNRQDIIRFFRDLADIAGTLAPSISTIATAMRSLSDFKREITNPGTLFREEMERRRQAFTEFGLRPFAPVVTQSRPTERIELIVRAEKGSEVTVTKMPRGNGRITLDAIHGPLMVGP